MRDALPQWATRGVRGATVTAATVLIVLATVAVGGAAAGWGFLAGLSVGILSVALLRSV